MNTPDLLKNKIHTRESIKHLLGRQHFFKRKIVFTNGCFDILHLGHVDYLAKASDFGDFFVLGLNSDASVKMLNKGSNRPLQDEHSRAMLIAAMDFVDAVVLFDEATPLELIQFVKPDVLVKGADYDAHEKDPKNKKYIVGSDVVRANGGEVKTIEFVEGYSTSAIEKKIRDSKI
ncbi:MAG: adenylyltransferase/cytidyltransferase family protein [Bacteroidetes bacterium]|jgi:rfaE bifunctional protein nucleotidyltransferase chain/domain|nr:adenylyltransferase/cytidyltransferase family protein [Bacteroidota bacterium]